MTAMSTYEVSSLTSSLVPSPVTYSTLRPAGAEGALPLLLWLHGGGGTNDFLETTRGVFETCWTDGSLPPMVVATPAAQRSFYLDRFDGSERWETFILTEFIDHLRQTTGAGLDGTPLLVGGVSMGGMGGLRMAFKYPTRFAAVAALEPGIEASATWDDVLARDRIYRSRDVLEQAYGSPVDGAYFTANHPLGIVDANAAAIVASGLGIYIEVGDIDFLHLAHGAEQLHRRLFDIGVKHEYRLVRGGDHVGPSLPPRMTDAVRFLGRFLDGLPGPAQPAAHATAFLAAGEAEWGYFRTEKVGELEVRVFGEGPMVVLIPSLGRGADDFEDLARTLADAGFRAVCPQPRGIGGSTAPIAGVTMADLAADIAAVIRGIDDEPEGARATVVGHAFGNRVARLVATNHPELVRDVVLLGCGGKVPAEPEHHEALLRSFDATLSPEEHLAAVQLAFFAEGNDPAPWADGWHGEVAKAQGEATGGTPVEQWWSAGAAPVLIVQPEHDVMAIRANADDLLTALGDRAELVVIPNAGHALLPEQPAAVATTLLRWLRR